MKLVPRTWIALALALLAQLQITDAANAEPPVNFEAGWLRIPIDGREFRLAAHIRSIRGATAF